MMKETGKVNPREVRINNTCLKQKVPGALVPVDANSLSRIAV